MFDQYGRKIEYLRLSLTDRCNLRCRYCMPEEGVQKMPPEELLTFEEIMTVLRPLAQRGIKKVRLTGGEPLVRRGLPKLLRGIARLPGIEQVALTTNGVLLAEMAESLLEAGLTELNISLDTLQAAVFNELTRRNLWDRVMAGIDKVRALGLRQVKINCVPLSGINEQELPMLAALAKDWQVKVRFIELMPVGCAWQSGYHGVPSQTVRQQLEAAYGTLMPAAGAEQGIFGPARYYKIPGWAGEIGFIDALEHKFCHSCNRVRMTADGCLKLCLNQRTGLDVKALLRRGVGGEELGRLIEQAVYQKPAEHFFGKKACQDWRAMYQVGG